MKYIVSIIFGLFFGAFILLWAILLSGGGDGWNGGFRYGLISVLACPMVAIALCGRSSVHSTFAVLTLIIGVITDLSLFTSVHEEYKYFQKVSFYAIPWIGLVLSWQVLAFVAIVINYKNEHNSL